MTLHAVPERESPEPPERAPWLRRVDFLDDHEPRDGEPPFHLPHHVWFNGEPTTVRVIADHGCSVLMGDAEATVVSFVVHPEDAQIGHRDLDGTNHDYMIGGLRVAVPRAMMWETIHSHDPVGLWGDDATEPIYRFVRVYAHVSEVNITHRRTDQ